MFVTTTQYIEYYEFMNLSLVEKKNEANYNLKPKFKNLINFTSM